MKRILITFLVLTGSYFIFTSVSAKTTPSTTHSTSWSVDKKTQTLMATAPDINPEALKLALSAYQCATLQGQSNQKILTLVDYSKASSQKRMWIFDLEEDKLLFNNLVAHGKGSGEVLPTHFSNQSQTHASSIGLFRTGDVYEGNNGYSLRLHGLEERFNEQALSRAIVVHGAPYVNNTLAANGRIGRSWGCPAVPQHLAKPIINTIKGGSLVFAYYPDSKWLAQSRYLHCDIKTHAFG